MGPCSTANALYVYADNDPNFFILATLFFVALGGPDKDLIYAAIVVAISFDEPPGTKLAR